MTVIPWARPDAENQLRATIRACHEVSGTDFVYGGLICAGGVRLSSFIGARTRGLHGLLVRPGMGLGGQVSEAQRPQTVFDYAADKGITHDYDRPVLREGIRSAAAIPVLVGQQTRGLLYAATRADTPVGGRVVEEMVKLAGRLADRLQIDDEVDIRLRLMGASLSPAPASSEDVRDVYRELRVLSQMVDDPILRGRLLQATQRLIGRPGAAPEPDPGLTHREIDVLAEVALGCTNRQIADRLSLATETVKAYLKSASHKLGTENRFQALSEARRRGLVP